MIHPKADQKARSDFSEKISKYEKEGREIVYLDESGFAQCMPRLYGYAKRGERCYGKHDWHARGRVNVIGAIIGAAFVTLSVFPCYVNSDVFYAWLTQDLLPKISKEAVIVMDNASFHKRTDMFDAINEHGCALEFLPPYSPDLNPIEKKWAQVKALRRVKRCSLDELFSEEMVHANLY